MAKFILDGQEYGCGSGGSNVIKLTQAEYNALPNNKLSDDNIYLITDSGELTAENLFYDGSQTGLGNNVQDAIDGLNFNMSNVKIYVGVDNKLHFIDSEGADTVIPFNNDDSYRLLLINALRNSKLNLDSNSTWNEIISALESLYPAECNVLSLAGWGYSSDKATFSITNEQMTYRCTTTSSSPTFSNTCTSPSVDFSKYSKLKIQGSVYLNGGRYHGHEVYIIDGKSTRISLSKSDTPNASQVKNFTINIDTDISSLSGMGNIYFWCKGKYANTTTYTINQILLY